MTTVAQSETHRVDVENGRDRRIGREIGDGREVGSGMEGVSGGTEEGVTGRERGRDGVGALLYYANLPNWFEVYCLKLVVSIPHAGPCTLHIKPQLCHFIL